MGPSWKKEILKTFGEGKQEILEMKNKIGRGDEVLGKLSPSMPHT